MSFWKSLQRLLGVPGSGRRSTPRTYSFDDETIDFVQELARREQRPPEEIAQSLMTEVRKRRQEAGEYLQHWQMLTVREQQVTALICLGYTNRQIASRLAISSDTVKTHIANIQRKFGLHSKADLRMALADWDFSAFDPEG